MTPIQQLFLGAGGGKEKTYIEDIFSMDTWRGTNATKTITNGIDLAGEGGMTWIKTRDVGDSGRYHALADTVRGTNKLIRANDTDEQKTISSSVQAFNSDGFELGGSAVVNWNTVGGSGDKYIGYTFRKAPGFFTIKQYTGTGSTQSLTHDLGSIPGAIFVKKLSGSPKSWGVYHRGQNNGVDPEDYRLRLNTIDAENNDTYWGDTAPTATHFTVGDAHDEVNVSGETYIAYLFGHEEATFGESSDKSVISCGYYSGNQVVGREIALGFEPQWLLIKRADSSESWFLWDTMRGIRDKNNEPKFIVNASTQEQNNNWVSVSANGFILETSVAEVNSYAKYVYIAIAAETGKTSKIPENGSDVFAMDTGNNSSTIPAMDSGFPVDMALYRNPNNTESWSLGSRLLGTEYMVPNTTAVQSSYPDVVWDSTAGFVKSFGSNYMAWMWKRGAGFDVVNYTGNGNNTDGANSINHSLSKTPEMIWIKGRQGGTYNGVSHWSVSHKGLNGGTNPWQYTMQLNQSNAEAATSNFGNTAPTSSVFYVGEDSNARTNHNNTRYIALLFASVAGISSVGSFTGNGSSSGPTITTGFLPRFILIKSTTTAESWWVADTLRGLGTSSDKLIALNQSFAQGSQVQNITTSSTGFTIIRNWAPINENNVKFIYYAHA